MSTTAVRYVLRHRPAVWPDVRLFAGRGAYVLLGRRLVHTGHSSKTLARNDEDDKQGSREDSAVTSSAASAAHPALPPLIYPEPRGAAKHRDLSSFLRYAERSNLNPATTTFVGTHYEYTVAACLGPFGFQLRRVGGASDRGIDLLGVWTLPIPDDGSSGRTAAAATTTVRVIVQCKAGAGQRIGPHLVRELEGAFVGAPVGWRSRVGEDGNISNNPAVIGLLVAEKPATKGIREALTRSRWPLAFAYCSSTGNIHQMLWNQRAEREGNLAGLGVTLRHNNADTADGGPAQIVLTWQGTPLPPAPAIGS